MSKRPVEEIASPEELVAAIAALPKEKLLRLYKLGGVYAVGSEFVDGKDLLGEAVKRALVGTSGSRQSGERGRPWPRDEDLVGFLAGCMKSIANGSQNSVSQKVARTAEALIDEEGEPNAELTESGAFHPGIDTQLIERDEAQARQAANDADVAMIEAHFSEDEDVLGILEGEKDGLTAAELRDLLDLSATAYDSARRRLRRNVDKLMPGRMRK